LVAEDALTGPLDAVIDQPVGMTALAAGVAVFVGAAGQVLVDRRGDAEPRQQMAMWAGVRMAMNAPAVSVCQVRCARHQGTVATTSSLVRHGDNAPRGG
jgi:uncharacterized membrane protein YgdD (TMEM256/DUF423 family)